MLCASWGPSSWRCRREPYKDANNYVHYSERLALALAKSEPNGAIWANQWDNTANRRAHIETTAQEIWTDTGGKVDGFVSAVGSGGTLGGVSDGLKAKRKGIQIALADVPGAALYSYYKTGELKAEGSSITEGIGQGRIPKTSKVPSSIMPFSSPTRSRCRSASNCWRKKGCAWVDRRVSTSPAPSVLPRSWVPGTPS